MKYLILVLLLLSGCSSAPKQFICLTALGGVQVDSSDPNVHEDSFYVSFPSEQGNRVYVPKSLCVMVTK